jgi:phenylpyruvate tautomerase PptA (4-oxalocrotonate tautomerase family)
MPMLDVTIPEDALKPEAEDALLATLTDLLLRHEGADPQNPVARSLAWVFLHRPARLYVAGAPAANPHYRVVASVPEGQFDDERRAALVAAVTEAVLDAEEGARPRDPRRVWVFANEVPDGNWGGAGRIHRLADIAGMVIGDQEKARQYAERRLKQARASKREV